MAVNPEFVDKVARELVTGYQTHNPKLVDEAMDQLLTLKKQQQQNPSYVDMTYHPTLARLSQNPELKAILEGASIIDIDAQRHSLVAMDKFGQAKSISDSNPHPVNIGALQPLTPQQEDQREQEQRMRHEQQQERALRQQEEALKHQQQELQRQHDELRKQQEELARRREQQEREQRERLERERRL